MKQKLFSALLAVLLSGSLAGCGGGEETTAQEDTLQILATTYPVYLFTTAVAQDAPGVEVSLLVNEQTSCLHDYTLTVNDMKAIEQADVIVMNGAGFEDFMADALATSDAAVIDCAQGVELLPATGHHDHDHGDETEGEHYDPHFWLDPARAAVMVETIQGELTRLDEGNGGHYAARAQDCAKTLAACGEELSALLERYPVEQGIITFHDGFQYFADAFGLTILKAIEEEEGSEASAADIKEIVSLIQEHQVPAVFTEKNGSDSTARAIARETGVTVGQLDMLMSGEGAGLDPYVSGLTENVVSLINYYHGEGTVVDP